MSTTNTGSSSSSKHHTPKRRNRGDMLSTIHGNTLNQNVTANYNNIKPKHSLDSVKDSAIGKRVISPGSGLPRQLNKAKSLRGRTLRARKSKLDLLDNKHLTSFPLEPPKIGGSDTESICIVEDYIPEQGPSTEHTAKFDKNSSTNTPWPCVGCLKTLNVQRHFIKQKTSFACEECVQSSPPFISSKSSDIIRIEPVYKGKEGNEPYYVMEQGIEWYSALRKTLRWRWRFKGLI